MFSGTISSNEANCLDFRMITDCIYGRNRPMDNIEDASRQTLWEKEFCLSVYEPGEGSLRTGTLAQLGNYHGGAWVTLGRFQNESIACNGSHGYRPQGYHPKDSERPV